MTDTPRTSDRERLRAALVAALDAAQATEPCSCGSKIWSSCFHPERPGRSHSERRADAVLAVRDAEVDRLRGESDELRHIHANTLPRLIREIQHHKDSKARWRGRAEKAEARVAELAGRPAEAHVLRQAAAQVEDDHPEAAATLYKAANVAEHAADQRPWQATHLAENLAGLDAMRADHPAPCRVPDSPDCTCPAELPVYARSDWDGPIARCSFGEHMAALLPSGRIGRHRMGEGWLNACPGVGKPPHTDALDAETP